MSYQPCKKFWLTNPSALLCSTDILPVQSMSLVKQMNTFTRLILVIFTFLILLGANFSYIFLILSLLFIIILYYIQRNRMETYQKENYKDTLVNNNFQQIPPQDFIQSSQIKNGAEITYIERNDLQNYICNTGGPIGANNPNYISNNQKLAGPANPKTKIPVVVVPPAAALDYWGANNLVTYTAINQETNTDLYASGYAVSECCGKQTEGKCWGPDTEKNPQIPTVVEGFSDIIEDFDVPKPVVQKAVIPSTTPQTQRERFGPNPRQNQRENFTVPKPVVQKAFIPSLQNNNQGQITENYEYPYLKTGNDRWGIVQQNQPGWVNTSCGYNPEQVFTSNLPSNLAVGNCQKSAQMADYNKNLFTQNIGPDVYSISQVNEPINSNIGISFQQQLEPVTCKYDKNGLTYTEHDPRIIEPAIAEPNLAVIDPVTESNVYDPRFSGYGTSYRAYNDKLLGQTRFMYDDINSVRMPNYISRSNIDHQPYADHYGPIPKGDEYGNKNTASIRQLANDSWLRGSLQFRTSLQQSLMRKRNNELWQLRSHPKSQQSYGASGGMGSRSKVAP